MKGKDLAILRSQDTPSIADRAFFWEKKGPDQGRVHHQIRNGTGIRVPLNPPIEETDLATASSMKQARCSAKGH